ncbi:hypothetical protein [Streptomyces millisiae]|uniref:hypothetical protein n=1 Tax=Streptomyces millisiae TaxID=3075542 RepID=UPI00374E0A3A
MREPQVTALSVGDLGAAFPQHPADGVRAAFPYRIYHDERPVDAVRSVSTPQRAILHCLYSRHSDGRVRQRHLEQIVSSDEPWVVPFVVQLAGEYVLEILSYGDFIARNPEFFARTERRMVSYWSCYYRWRFPVFGSYPGCHLLGLLRAAASERTSRPWPRHAPSSLIPWADCCGPHPHCPARSTTSKRPAPTASSMP